MEALNIFVTLFFETGPLLSQDDLELTWKLTWYLRMTWHPDLPASTSQMLGLYMCAIKPGYILLRQALTM